MKITYRTSVFFFVACIACIAHAGETQRIISLKPNITDIVYALGLGERLVGVTRYCDIPARPLGTREASSPTPEIIGDYVHPSIERIIALRPDVVLGSEENSSRRSIESLRRLRIPVELFPFTTLAETIHSIRAIGATLGVPKKGEELALGMERGFAALKSRWSSGNRKRVVVVWGLRPMVVAGPGTYMDELLGLIGASSAVKETNAKFPRIGIEEMIALNPDVIVDFSMGSENPRPGSRVSGFGSRVSSPEKDQRPWDNISAIKAVREERVIAMDVSEFRAGPQLPGALEKLAEKFHDFGTRDPGPETRNGKRRTD